MPFDLEAARKAGKTDTQIANYLGAALKFDVEAARKSGKTDEEIASYLSINDRPPIEVSTKQELTVPPWAAKHPTLYGIYGAAKETLSPMVEAGGAALGAISGFPLGPVTSLALAGAGYAGGKGIIRGVEELVGERAPLTLPEAALQTGKDVAVGAVMEAGGQVLGPAIGAAKKVLRLEKPVEAVIKRGIEKGVKPGVTGKETEIGLKSYEQKADKAVKTIIANKQNLSFLDESGEVISGKLPENLRQFTQAIDQTKRRVFAEYDELATQAGQKGAVVNLNPVAKELRKVATDPVIKNEAPSVAKYAQAKAEAYEATNYYSAEQAQDAIKIFNDRLDAFYKNPSYENATLAQVDAAVANHMRKALDDTIANISGPGYQSLKNTYGSLRAIEKDVTTRANKEATKDIKGFLGFSDIYSGSEIIAGILTLRPVMVLKGLSLKGLGAAFAHYNSPNTIVKKMFRKVGEKIAPKTPKPSAARPAAYMIGMAGEEE